MVATKATVDRTADQHLRTLRARVLDKYAPGTTVRPIRWPGGDTQVLELGAKLRDDRHPVYRLAQPAMDEHDGRSMPGGSPCA